MRYAMLSIVAALALGPLAHAQTAVIGTRTADGKISFDEIEELLIDQSHKVRLAPESTTSLDNNTSKRLNKIEIRQAGLLRLDAKGRIVHLNGPKSESDVVLPENLSVKAPTGLDTLAKGLALTLVKSKKSKDTSALPQEQFFMYEAGPSPDRAVLNFLLQAWAFRNEDEQLEAMEGFVRSFPTSPAREEFRALLQQQLAAGRDAFENGGPWTGLLQTRKYALLARRAFPGDQQLGALHDAIQGRIGFVVHSVIRLRSLANLFEWDAFLDQYAPFEPYQGSSKEHAQNGLAADGGAGCVPVSFDAAGIGLCAFEELRLLRRRALEESARQHARRARAFTLRDDHEAAIREIRFALLRDPANTETKQTLDDENVLGATQEAKRNAAARKPLAPDSPAGRRFTRALSDAKHAIADKAFKKAEDAIQEAEAQDEGAPEILLAKAQLLASTERLSDSVPLLDRYDRLVVDPAAVAEGVRVRDDILYDLNTKRDALKAAIKGLLADGDFTGAHDKLEEALTLDGNDDDFLYFAGYVDAALRRDAPAKELLNKFLTRSNSLTGDLVRRNHARRIVALLSASPRSAAAAGTPSWFSGRRLPEGVVYCPESIAFQLPFDSVVNGKTRIAFNWDRGRLDSIVTTFEDEKAKAAYRAWGESGAQQTPDEALGKFYFYYLPTSQIRGVRAKKVAKATAAPLHVAKATAAAPLHLADDDGEPQVVLADSPQVNPRVMALLGLPVTTLVAGNSFFNPFLWDSIHYFSAVYDGDGRVESASEWNVDNRLTFAWDGDRLKEIRAYRRNSAEPYYTRSISYSGSQIAEEGYSGNGRGGKIRYIYKDGGLREIRADGPDGKAWIVHPRS